MLRPRPDRRRLPLRPPGRAAWAGLAAGCLLAVAFAVGADAAEAGLRLVFRPEFGPVPLVFDAPTNTTAAGQVVGVTRLDFLVSGVALHQAGGGWWEAADVYAYISGREGRLACDVPGVPDRSYDRLRFQVGVPAAVNHRPPNDYPANHPLHPGVNGLHWGWMGGYVFLALEGNWRDTGGDTGGFSYHFATDTQLMTVELPVEGRPGPRAEWTVGFAVDRIFAGPHPLRITAANTSSHSRTNDSLAGDLRANVVAAFHTVTAGPAPTPDAAAAGPTNERVVAPLVAATAHPYKFTISAFFPRPALPRDNPLTEEGVALGARLFTDPLLSGNHHQSCSSCHRPATAFTDGLAVSPGTDGEAGTRSSMPLLNLAWKSTFFWDGRAATLREQVVQPIENPVEMHSTLPEAVGRLTADPDYPTLFERAFGSREINPDRLARALEQFLLVQESHQAKFDRVLAGTAQLTPEEQRGFDLFHTEYDPRHGQFGADCFHCHGGPLFQSQNFANNGLAPAGGDTGRQAVTHRDGDAGKFAVPSLRNVAVTAPYMHDGRFTTLAEVVAHYAGGVVRSATLDPNLAKHPPGGLDLSAADQRALIAFLETLTDERYLPARGRQ